MEFYYCGEAPERFGMIQVSSKVVEAFLRMKRRKCPRPHSPCLSRVQLLDSAKFCPRDIKASEEDHS